MGFQPVINTCSVELVFWNGTAYSENVLHIKQPTRPTEQDMISLAQDLRAYYASVHAPNQPATIFLSKIIIKDLTQQFAPAIEYTAGMPLPGARDVQLMPMNVTVAVKLVTGKRGRSYRGRIYHVGLAVDDVVGDKLAPGYAGILKSRYEDLLNVNFPSGNGEWCVVSRWENLLPRAAGLATPITGIEVDEVLDSQRRRLLGRGQ